ncbi:MAG: hypothetical protein ABW005_07430 [Burkholderiaceae bacterium]
MFGRRLTELRQRQLALRLRNIELRAELHAEAQHLAKPLAWLGVAGAAAGTGVLLAMLRKPGRWLRLLGAAKMGLRLSRLWKSFSP